MPEKRKHTSTFLRDNAPQAQSVVIAVLSVFCFLVLLGAVIVLVRLLFGLGQ